MAEIVQFKIEGMVPELEDLERKKLFTKAEIKSIVKRRTNFEYSIRRRGPSREDFLRYIEYEMNLDALRRKRKARLGIKSKKATVSDFAITNRIKVLFERALTRHKGDIGIWKQYIDFARRSNQTRLQSELYARAIQVFPREPSFWIAAASFEFDENANMVGARALMQRGLRLNPKDRSMWHMYFRLELIYIEKVKARRRLLAIDGSKPSDDEGDSEPDSDMIRLPTLEEEEEQEAPSSVKGLREKTRSILAAENNPVLQGAITRLVYQRAIQAIPNDLDFRVGFASLYMEAGDADLSGALQEVFASIERDFARDEGARAYLASANLKTVNTQSPEFVDELARAVTEFDKAAAEVVTSAMYLHYLKFLFRWHQVVGEPNLRLYLTGMATKLIADAEERKLLDAALYEQWVPFVRAHNGHSGEAHALAAMATDRFPDSPRLWALRVDMLLPGARRSEKAARKLDGLFQSKILPANPTSEALWMRWFNWTEWQWRHGRIATAEAMARYMAATSRCGTLDSSQRALKGRILIRFLDWAAGVPASKLEDKSLEAMMESDSEDDVDLTQDDETRRQGPVEESGLSDSGRCEGEGNDDNGAGGGHGEGRKMDVTNIDTVRLVSRKIQLQTLPPPEFYIHCIKYERTFVAGLESKLGMHAARRSTDYKVTMGKIHALYQQACGADTDDPEPWIDYIEFVHSSGQGQLVTDVHWKATRAIKSLSSLARFESAYQRLVKLGPEKVA